MERSYGRDYDENVFFEGEEIMGIMGIMGCWYKHS
jgi:hypothetical protein